MNHKQLDTIYIFLIVLLLSLLISRPLYAADCVDGEAGLYHSYCEIAEGLKQLENNYPNIAKVYDIGDSHGNDGDVIKTEDNRDILAIKISDNAITSEITEPKILFVGGHHAREWISVDVPFKLAEYLITNYDADPYVRQLVDGREIWIVPMVNPDGHQYSIEHYRYWRKNRRDNGDGTIGVDLNRNYDYKWDPVVGNKTSTESLDDTYRGKLALSEPETRAIRDLILEYDFQVVVSYHSYGQKIIYPWGYKEGNDEYPNDKILMNNLAANMSVLIKAANSGAGEDYRYGQASEILYKTSGDLGDWVYGRKMMPTFTIELRPTCILDSNLCPLDRFELPQSEIEPTFQENLDAALYITEWSHLTLPKYGDICGSIFTDNSLVQGALVSLFDVAGNYIASDTTNENGFFSIKTRIGGYYLSVSRDGYHDLRIPEDNSELLYVPLAKEPENFTPLCLGINIGIAKLKPCYIPRIPLIPNQEYTNESTCQNYFQQYEFTVTPGEYIYRIIVEPTSGDPDLYASRDNTVIENLLDNNGNIIWNCFDPSCASSTASGEGLTEKVVFFAPQSGDPYTSYFAVYGKTETDYNVKIVRENISGGGISLSNIDTALIIDSSGSMRSNDRYNNRLEAGRFFIDLAEDYDYISVVDFDSSARVWAPLQIVQNHRDTLKSAVNRVNSSGGTNIGRGLSAGYSQLNSSPTDNDKIAILLTDGRGSYSNQAQSYINRGWRVFTIGLSSAVDRNLLENRIALPTGGRYYGVTTQDAARTAIQEIYQDIRQLVVGEEVVSEEDLLIFLGQIVQRRINLENYLRQVIFTRLIEGSDVEMSLVQPDGTVIDRNTNDPEVYHALGSTYEVYKINYPQPGEWTIILEGTDVPNQGEQTNLTVSMSKSDLDGDGIKDDIDNCLSSSNQNQEDYDGDNIGDVCDVCPNDPENDNDQDGVCEEIDNCLNVYNPDQADCDNDDIGNVCDTDSPCSTDSDGDGVTDDVDNCPNDPSKTEPGICGCGITDTDSDNDGIPDCNDICPTGDDTLDCDFDGTPNACDTEPDCNGNRLPDNCDIASGASLDCNANNIPDECELDTDGDGVIDACDNCPEDTDNDIDKDGRCGNEDNCPAIANPDQIDCDNDGIGDACDVDYPCLACNGTINGSGYYYTGRYRTQVSTNIDSGNLASGTLRYYNTRKRLSLTSSSITSVDFSSAGVAVVNGTGAVNRRSGYTFTATIRDNASDEWEMIILDSGGNTLESASGTLSRGNLAITTTAGCSF